MPRHRSINNNMQPLQNNTTSGAAFPTACARGESNGTAGVWPWTPKPGTSLAVGRGAGASDFSYSSLGPLPPVPSRRALIYHVTITPKRRCGAEPTFPANDGQWWAHSRHFAAKTMSDGRLLCSLFL